MKFGNDYIGVYVGDRGFSLDVDLFHFVFTLKLKRKPRYTAVAVTSITDDGKHVPILDYDAIYKDVFLDDVTRLMNEFDLQAAVIFCSEIDDNSFGNFNVMFLDKCSWHEALDIIEESTCDRNYLDNVVRREEKAMALRISEKAGKSMDFLSTIVDPVEDGRELSNAHTVLIQKHWDAKLDEIIAETYLSELTFGSGSDVEFVSYGTAGG